MNVTLLRPSTNGLLVNPFSDKLRPADPPPLTISQACHTNFGAALAYTPGESPSFGHPPSLAPTTVTEQDTVCIKSAARTTSPRMPLGATDREEVERRFQVARAKREIACGDRRREAIVERARQPEPAVDPVPAERQRELVEVQLAGME